MERTVNQTNILKLTYTGLLIAIGIMIPMFSPLRILIPPASFTLASHAAIFVAMFISPGVTITVALGTTLGFWLGAFPDVIVLRALSHVIFAGLGAFYLSKRDKDAIGIVHMRVLSAVLNVIHGAAELAVVLAFNHFVLGLPFEPALVWPVVGLVGLGTVIHGFVDLELAMAVRKVLNNAGLLRGI